MADGPLDIARSQERVSALAGAAPLQRRLLSWAPLGLLCIAFLVLLVSGVLGHVSWGEFRARRLILKGVVARHPLASLGVYVALYAAMVALSLPGALVMTLAGGILFGVVMGAMGAVLAVSGGSMVMFLAAHTAAASVLRRRIQAGGLLDRVEAGICRHAFSYILFLRLMPAAPIWLVNVCAGLVRAPVGVFALATVIGVTPSTVIYASLGSDLDHALAMGQAPSMDAALNPLVWLPLVGLACLALLPVAADRWRKRW